MSLLTPQKEWIKNNPWPALAIALFMCCVFLGKELINTYRENAKEDKLLILRQDEIIKQYRENYERARQLYIVADSLNKVTPNNVIKP
jgi:hypothetical protein